MFVQIPSLLLIVRYNQHYPAILAQLTVKWDEITPIGKATYNYVQSQLTIRGENVPVAKEELGTSPNHLKQAISE